MRVVALVVAVIGFTSPLSAQTTIPDSIANPIVLSGGERVDPAFSLEQALKNNGDWEGFRDTLLILESTLRHKNAPLGIRWFASDTLYPQNRRFAERGEVLGALKSNYQAWYSQVYSILGADIIAASICPSQKEPPTDTRPRGISRCLRRSLFGVLGLFPLPSILNPTAPTAGG